MAPRLALFASGSGRTVENLVRRARDGRLAAEPVLLICSSRRAGAIERAERLGLPCVVVPRRRRSADAYSAALYEAIKPWKPDLILLAGFLHLLRIPEVWTHRVLNIHPSLIPAFCGTGFYGARVHEAVRESGVTVTGCTVHFCDNIYDHGPIIAQQAVPVHAEDDAAAIARRVFRAELELYPRAINLVARGLVTVRDGRCRIREPGRPGS